MELNGNQCSQWSALTHLWLLTEKLLRGPEAAAALLVQPANEADRSLPPQVSPPCRYQEVLRPHSPERRDTDTPVLESSSQ